MIFACVRKRDRLSCVTEPRCGRDRDYGIVLSEQVLMYTVRYPPAMRR
jgi:hypothetical protein